MEDAAEGKREGRLRAIRDEVYTIAAHLHAAEILADEEQDGHFSQGLLSLSIILKDLVPRIREVGTQIEDEEHEEKEEPQPAA